MPLVRKLQAGPIGPNPFDSLIRQPFFSARSQAGKTVTVDSALRFDAVWACVRRRAETTGMMPLRVYERLADDEQQPARNQRVIKLLRKPNREHNRMNAFSLISTHVNSWGNGFFGKEFTRIAGKDVVTGLWPIPAGYVRITREGGIKYFWVRDSDTGREYPDPFTDREITHFMGFSTDGLTGLSPVSYARESIGAGLAMDHFLNSFWKNSGVPPLVLSSEQQLTPAARKRMRRDWDRVQRGFRNAWRTAILEQGVKATPLSMPLKDAEFIATGDHNVQKICRWFGMWPSMIGAASSDAMTYKNLEGESLRFLMFTMNPEWSLIEQTLEADPDIFPLRPGDMEPQFFPEFERSKFLQVDPLTQNKVDAISTGGRGWKKPSEIRKARHLKPDSTIDSLIENPPASVPSEGSGG
jgi:HK97 family phage portal protein